MHSLESFEDSFSFQAAVVFQTAPESRTSPFERGLGAAPHGGRTREAACFCKQKHGTQRLRGVVSSSRLPATGSRLLVPGYQKKGGPTADRRVGIRKGGAVRPAHGVEPADCRFASGRVLIPPGQRRGRDSNPRYPYGHTAFPVPHNRPLCHLSVGRSTIAGYRLLTSVGVTGGRSPRLGARLRGAARGPVGKPARRPSRIVVGDRAEQSPIFIG